MNNLHSAIIRWVNRDYLIFKYVIDLSIWAIAAPLAFILRLEAHSLAYLHAILIYVLYGTFLKAVLVYWLGIYRQSWHKSGIKDLYDLIRAVGLGTLVLLSLSFLVGEVVSIPRSIPLLDGTVAL